MATDRGHSFSKLVQLAFSTEQEGARTLWVPVAQEFDRNGPEAAREYLAAQRQHLVGQVKKLLDRVRERLDG